ncbi:hypothetical protein FHETE_39 [Fusarium heterosporum]|uniref:Uncharacterized protein n=1 Tax=Fusarium heterosporum TaxID=42747 RepID=A0A8H5TZJ1_FUSHE|nr:hypothetical protein FHETE_39 [Fusarium heterosporum]
MKSDVILAWALSLLAVDFAVAGPCKPTSVKTTTAISSAASTETPSSTSNESLEASLIETATSATSSITSDGTSTFLTSLETSALSATTEPTTTTIALTTETTSTASIPTFTVVAIGESYVKDKSLAAFNQENIIVTFGTDTGAVAYPYSIDALGRISNDQGWFLCGAYIGTYDNPNVAAVVVTCKTEIKMRHEFLTCDLTVDHKLQCSIPAITCVADSQSLGTTFCQPASAKYWGSE